MKNRYNFSNITLDELNAIVNIKEINNENIFDEWFNYKVNFKDEDNEKFLNNLILKHKTKFHHYLEEDIKMKFLAPIFAKIDFENEIVSSWYEWGLKANLNNITLYGKVDFMLASGIEKPNNPYFFIQEFKKATASKHPINQLLAEMLVAMKLNKIDLIRGAYIIGQNWNFVILKRVSEFKYNFFISKSFDSLFLSELKQIYKNLVYIKELYIDDKFTK